MSYFKWKELNEVYGEEELKPFTPSQIRNDVKDFTDNYKEEMGYVRYSFEEEAMLALKFLEKHGYHASFNLDDDKFSPTGEVYNVWFSKDEIPEDFEEFKKQLKIAQDKLIGEKFEEEKYIVKGVLIAGTPEEASEDFKELGYDLEVRLSKPDHFENYYAIDIIGTKEDLEALAEDPVEQGLFTKEEIKPFLEEGKKKKSIYRGMGMWQWPNPEKGIEMFNHALGADQVAQADGSIGAVGLAEKQLSKGEKIAQLIAKAFKGQSGPFGGENPHVKGNTVTFSSQLGSETWIFNDDGSVDDYNDHDDIIYDEDRWEEYDFESEEEAREYFESISHFDSVKELFDSGLTWFMDVPNEEELLKDIDLIISDDSLEEASSAEKKAFKDGGKSADDYIQGKAIARIKDPKAREAAIAAKKAGRDDVVKSFTGDRKEDQAERSAEKKFSKMQKAGLKESKEINLPHLDALFETEGFNAPFTWEFEGKTEIEESPFHFEYRVEEENGEKFLKIYDAHEEFSIDYGEEFGYTARDRKLEKIEAALKKDGFGDEVLEWENNVIMTIHIPESLNEVWANGSGPGHYESIDYIARDLEEVGIKYVSNSFDEDTYIEVAEEDGQRADEIICNWVGENYERHQGKGEMGDNSYEFIIKNKFLYDESLKKVPLKESKISWEEAVKDSYNHFVSDLGRKPSASEILEDVVDNYSLDIDIKIELDDPFKYNNWLKDVEEILRKLNLEIIEEKLNESFDLPTEYQIPYESLNDGILGYYGMEEAIEEYLYEKEQHRVKDFGYSWQDEDTLIVHDIVWDERDLEESKKPFEHETLVNKYLKDIEKIKSEEKLINIQSSVLNDNDLNKLSDVETDDVLAFLVEKDRELKGYNPDKDTVERIKEYYKNKLNLKENKLNEKLIEDEFYDFDKLIREKTPIVIEETEKVKEKDGEKNIICYCTIGLETSDKEEAKKQIESLLEPFRKKSLEDNNKFYFDVWPSKEDKEPELDEYKDSKYPELNYWIFDLRFYPESDYWDYDDYIENHESLKEEWQYCNCKDLDEVAKLSDYCAKNGCKITAKTSTNDGYKCRIEGPFDNVHKVNDKWSMFKWRGTPLEESIEIKPGSTTIVQKYKEFDNKQEAENFIISEKGYGEMIIRYIPKTKKYRVVWEEIAESLEKSIEDIKEDIEKHNTLNPKLFDGEELKPEVKETVEKIADEFVKELANDGIKFTLKDIVLLGSNVSYNYTKDSDLDIHLIADSEGLECPDDLYPLLYSAYRSMFNKNYDISIKDIPSEIYVEMDEPAAKSNGIYSLNSGWIKKPEQTTIPDLDQESFNKLFTEWEDKYFELIKDQPDIEITGDEESVEKAKEILDKEFDFDEEKNIRDKEEE